jgi:hypothetical protein
MTRHTSTRTPPPAKPSSEAWPAAAPSERKLGFGYCANGATTNWSENFNYDSFGNRWVSPNPVGISLSAWTVTAGYYNSPTDRLTFNNFGYDNAGNQTTISPYAASYDVENRQTGFTSTNNGSATYTYDGGGRRVDEVPALRADRRTRTLHQLLRHRGKIMRTLTPWKRLAPTLLVALSLASVLQAQAPTLSKEYIRLGGRILALEVQAAPPGYVAPVYENWAYLNTAPTVPYMLVGAGDFDRNGVPDLVYMNTSTRQVVVNYYGGAGGAVDQGWAYLNEAGEPAGWTVVAVADMNGDGVPDLIWQNASTSQVTVNYYGGVGGAVYQGWANLHYEPGWTVVAAADFDGNGTPDLVWQNAGANEVQVDYYAGATYLSSASLTSASGWTVRGAADMNGDGVPDLIWQNNSTGQVTVNFYGGTGGASYEGWGWLHQSTDDSGWRVGAVADMDGNGTPDLIWQQIASPYAVTVNYYNPA